MINTSLTIKLNPDQQSTTARLIKDSSLAFSQLLSMINSNNIESEYATSILSLVEFNLANLANSIGVYTNTASDIEERYAKLKQANSRIRELERQLGEAANINLVGPSIELLEDKMRYWWSVDGFGHLSEFSVSKGFANIKLSTTLFGRSPGIMSDSPISSKELQVLWLQSLRDQGYVFLSDNRGSDKELIDCDKNKALISALIINTLPSAVIKGTTNQGNRYGQLILREIDIFVRDLNDLNNLTNRPVSDC